MRGTIDGPTGGQLTIPDGNRLGGQEMLEFPTKYRLFRCINRTLALSQKALVLLALYGSLYSAPTSADEQEISFQHGVEGYAGTIDIEVWALAPKTILNTNPNATCDANNDGGESQVLMRFDNIIGNAPRQIPPHATVISAKLIVSAFDQGNTVNLHRLLVPFDESATWDSLVSAISADGLEAARHKDGFTFGTISATTSGAIFDVSDTVQTWVNGNTNHGWVFLNTGGNGWDFYTSEFDKIEQRPKLIVRYLSPKQ